MNTSKTIARIAILGALTAAPAGADNVIPDAPSWSTPARTDVAGHEAGQGDLTVDGSDQSYTQVQIDDKFSAPDWFPDQHLPMPETVQFGKGPKVWACASCHLTSGTGHPESASLAGLDSAYMQAQMRAFSDGTRVDYSGHMNRMAALMTPEEIQTASDWFASLTPRTFIEVIETETVPASYIDSTRMRLLTEAEPREEPIAGRIIEIPVDPVQVKLRHPVSNFISYVPTGSIARGEALVSGDNDRTYACAGCHGDDLTGTEIAPVIIGNFGIYTVRQLHGFKSETRSSEEASLMSDIVVDLTDQDIIDIAAYLSAQQIN
ncbi:c-type cytochrome [Parasedimentitalea psychrophila]|uniref:C-type cytochrome n=1 Tax=Parasedimentitalea psychrophila TaxID=2997337 RepID=A0A9Y2L4F9_9RHOB|nr:c-type cytochrome [Parasedimentitalea psychrophila]WIY27790.1 c-type cytochrome [Parasedimentitalea psychrophila]